MQAPDPYCGARIGDAGYERQMLRTVLCTTDHEGTRAAYGFLQPNSTDVRK